LTARDSNTREVSLARAAHLLRRSRGTLANAISEGLPAEFDRSAKGATEWRIDVGKAARWFERRAVEHERERLEERHRIELERVRSALENTAGDADEPLSWQEARRRRAAAEARIREIDAAEREGNVVEVDVIADQLSGLFMGMRNHFLYISGVLAPLCAAESSAVVCQKLIDEEIRRILTDIADSSPEEIVASATEESQSRARGRR